jgi:hypothetical protein
MEVNEAPSPPMTQTKPTWQTHALSPNGRSTSSRSRNATAGPSGTRHSDKPREVVKIEGDDSDDDFKMLDEPPEVFSRSATALFKREIATEEERYPTPPQTPLEQNDDILIDGDPQRRKTIAVGPKPRYREPNEPMTLQHVYYHYAARVDQMADPHCNRRKRVIQAEWFHQCLRAGRRGKHDDRVDWEVLCVSSL